MIEGFELETGTLTEYERKTLLPIMVKCLQRKTGKENAITNKVMCNKMQEYGYDLTEARTRKIINYIRTNNLVSCLMASNRGYYVAECAKEIKNYIQSLKGREDAIKAVREALEKQVGMCDKE